MSQDDSLQGKPNRGLNDPRINVHWTPAVSCSEVLAIILKPENKKLFVALHNYVDRALVSSFGHSLRADDRDDLFMDALANLHGERHAERRFAYLFGMNCEGHHGPLGAYVAVAAKNLYLSELRRAERAAGHRQTLIELHKRLETAPSLLEVLVASENLNLFREKVGKLFEAGRAVIDRRHWNGLLESVGARWPVQLGELAPLWPGVTPALNQGTRGSDRNRARAQMTELAPEYSFNEDEIDVLRALRIIF